MKKLLFLLLFVAFNASAQIQLLDTTTLHTNVYSTAGKITAGTVFTNTPYTVSDYTNVSPGEISASAGAKINSNFAYVTNAIAALSQLPGQINSNIFFQITGITNQINGILTNLMTLSNNLASAMTTLTNLPGANIQSSTISTNKLTTATMTWLNSLQEVQPDTGGFGGTTLKLGASDTGTAMYLHVDSSGTITATVSP